MRGHDAPTCLGWASARVWRCAGTCRFAAAGSGRIRQRADALRIAARRAGRSLRFELPRLGFGHWLLDQRHCARIRRLRAKARHSRRGAGSRFRWRFRSGDDCARSRHPPAGDGHDRRQDHAAAADRAGRTPRPAHAQRQLRIHVRLRAARRLAPPRAAAGTCAGPPDLARQEAQECARVRIIPPRSST